jgi:hypothetical protein
MKKFAILFTAALALSGLFGPSARAFGVDIEVGDRPYYTHGARYWSNGAWLCWHPGHWGPRRRHWIPGHYGPC